MKQFWSYPDDPEIKVHCLFETASGLITSHVKISLPSDLMNSDCVDESTMLVITSPDGSFTSTIDFPNNPVEGIFVPYTIGLKNACFEFNLENSNEQFKHCNCLETFCVDLPEHGDCPFPDDCDMNVSFDYLDCTLGGTPNLYEFTLSITTNSDYTVWFSVPNGNLSGMPSTLTNGLNTINGLFSLNSAPYDEFCITINAYDLANQKYCQLKVCYEDGLPHCVPHRLSSGNASISSNLSEPKLKTSLKLAPNPASDNLSVSFVLSANSGTMIIFDVRGQEVFNQRLNQVEGKLEVNTSTINPGIYWVRIESDSGENAGSRLVIIK